MPVGERPAAYGAEGVPGNIVGQMIHPFQVIARRLRPQPRLRAPAA